MSEYRTCPQCGERVEYDPEQHYCMFCGSDLIEEVPPCPSLQAGNNLEENNVTEDASVWVDYKPHWWQTLVGIYLALLVLGIFLLSTFQPLLYYVELRLFRFTALATGLGIAVLLAGVRNRASLTTLVIFLVTDILSTLYFLLDIIPLMGDFAPLIFVLSLCLPTVYAYSLLAQNNEFQNDDRTWLNFLVVIDVLNVFWESTPLWLNTTGDVNPLSYINYFNWVISPLTACAWWKVAPSAAFAGGYDKDAPCDFSPLNRYMAMILIAPVLMSVGMFFLSKYMYVFPN